MKRGFTLIELLVVIAIIAILAAILFPVFAQAKVAAKKAVDLSNTKQIALATVMYSGDFDDYFPMGFGHNCAGGGGGWDMDSRIPVPANWSAETNADFLGSCSGDGRRENAGMVAAPNTLYPYSKNYGLLQMPGAPLQFGYTSPQPGDGTPANVSYNFNGELQSYSQTGVVDPSGTATWWPAFGQVARIGDTYAEPFLICPNALQSCVFTGSGVLVNNAAACHSDSENNTLQSGNGNGSESGMGNIHYTSWCFGKSENWCFADGHAKSRQMGTGDQNLDPWPINGYNAEGVPDSAAGYEGHEAVFDQYCEVPLFRPDITHNP